jgi:hypothetical protein
VLNLKNVNMEFFKMLEIVENLVKGDREKALKLKRYTHHGDSKNSAYLLAYFVQNEPQIHEDLLKVLENRNKWEKISSKIIENGLFIRSENPLNDFINLNLKRNEFNPMKIKHKALNECKNDIKIKNALKGPALG